MNTVFAQRPHPASDLTIFRSVENGLLALSLVLMIALPILDLALREMFRASIPGGSILLQHMTLVVAMLGAASAAREGKLISLSNVQSVLRGKVRALARWCASLATATVAIILAYAAWVFVRSEWEADKVLLFDVPAWVIQWVMPGGFVLIALRSVQQANPSAGARWGMLLAALVVVLTFNSTMLPRGTMMLVGLGLIAVAASLGTAVFAVLGGTAILLFWGRNLPIASLAVDQYRLVVNPALPAIPLFTLAGYFLAEGGAPTRLIRVFRALFGNVRGGAAAVTVVACAFFTAFTGGSGLTILTLGPLLLPLLLAAGQTRRASLGLVTSAGALGVLLPPSLPMILYAVVAKVPLQDLFIRAIGPAALMVLLAFIWARLSERSATPEAAPTHEPLRSALWDAKWELLMPLVACIALFGGWATAVEAAALTALYAFGVEVFIHRGLSLRTDVPRVIAESAMVVGGILLILGVALGLNNFLADAQIPDRLVAWVQANIQSKWAFLLALNVFLLGVGCLMDIFSAIVVVVPLINPLAAAFGLDPIHLAIIFLANMELGYLTPPVGMNLFFAAYRFDLPLAVVALAVLPYVAVLALGVLIITYVPWITGGG